MAPNLPTNTTKDEVPALLETLKCQRKKRQWAYRSIWVLLPVSVVVMGISETQSSSVPIATILLALLISPLVFQLLMTRDMKTLKRISKHEDTRSISVLMDTLFEQNFPNNMYVPVIEVMTVILPKVTFDVREAFTSRHIELLHVLFLRYHDQRLCTQVVAYSNLSSDTFVLLKKPLPESLCHSLRVATLHALVQIGTEETARVLKQFIQQRCHSSTQMGLQKLAQTSLMELEKRLTRENEAKTLLRASQYTEDYLLRPSYATAIEAPETLLRASVSPAATPIYTTAVQTSQPEENTIQVSMGSHDAESR